MDELSAFCLRLKPIIESASTLDINQARNVIKEINEFLYTNYDGIGKTQALGTAFDYFSDFHKYWEANHKEILNCEIVEDQCELVADALHEVYMNTGGQAFISLYDTCNLSDEEVARVRLLTANQDFRGSRNFSELAKIYKADNSRFDVEVISNDPVSFLKTIGVTSLSQNDKRGSYAKKFAEFLLERDCSPYGLIDYYNRDIFALRNDMINCKSAGYGNKKTDMVLRDMVMLGIWRNVKNFDKIDVASDINTIKVALRTEIIKTEIPLVSSFIDIFCHQYGYIDEMNAKAWRRVWEIWSEKYPLECISSPCQMDYFIYGVIGRQFCKENLYLYKCCTESHIFRWHSGRNRTCQLCFDRGIKNRNAIPIKKVMACSDSKGKVAFLNSDYVSSLPREQQKFFEKCPLSHICGDRRYLAPPKSISILGQTGWTTAYTKKNEGGGGLMS